MTYDNVRFVRQERCPGSRMVCRVVEVGRSGDRKGILVRTLCAFSWEPEYLEIPNAAIASRTSKLPGGDPLCPICEERMRRLLRAWPCECGEKGGADHA